MYCHIMCMLFLYLENSIFYIIGLLCSIARSERDGTCAETRFGLSRETDESI